MKIYTVKNDKGQSFDVNEDKLNDAEKDGYLPTVSNGKEEHRVSIKDMPMALKDGYNPITTSDISQTESTLRGAAQGLSFGFGDELVGGAEAALDAAKNLSLDNIKENYIKHRNESRQANSEAEAANPKTYMAGNLLGAVAPAIVSGGASLPESLASMAARGAVEGAAYGLGNSEGSVTDDIKNTLVGGAIGGVAGAALGKAIPMISDAASSVGNKLGNTAENLAERSLGASGIKATEAVSGTGRELLDRGIVNKSNILSGSKGASEKILEGLESTGDKFSPIMNDIKGITPKEDIVAAINAKANEIAQNPAMKGVADKLRKSAENLTESSSELNAPMLENIKRGYANTVDFTNPESKIAERELSKIYRGATEDLAQQTSPEVAQSFQNVKKDYGFYKNLEGVADKNIAKPDDLFSMQSLGKKAVVGGGLHLLGAPGSAIAGIGGALTSSRGMALGAVTTDTLSKILQQAPQTLGKYAPVLANAAQRGATALSAAHFVLQQQSPEYRQRLEQLQNKEPQ